MMHQDIGRNMWTLLNSKKFAVYVLTIFLAMLVVSTFLPNYYTLSETQWYELERSKPSLYWIASHFSTPFLVEGPVFLLVSLFLFLSTLVCTTTRVSRWYRFRTSEFSKDKAFSFTIEETSSLDTVAVKNAVLDLLGFDKWECSAEQTGESFILSGQKGRSGLWGSVVFHLGLVVCFLAGPVTVLTHFRGTLILTEGAEVPLRAGFESHTGKDPATLPDVQVMVHNVKGDYFKGKYNYYFGGRLVIDDAGDRLDIPFAVNKPASFRGYEFQLHEFGYSPHIIISRAGVPFFDYFLNLRHSSAGDYFEIGGGLQAFVMFFPDFIKEGGKVGSKSRMPDNPVTMVKIRRGGQEIFKGLFKPGDEYTFGEYSIKAPEYKHWVNLIVVRESGIIFVIIGFVLGVTGLFVRFLSNERRTEFELASVPQGTRIRISGFSRYYPAFLEKEVREMTKKLKSDLKLQ